MNSDITIQVKNLSKIYQLRKARAESDEVSKSEHWALKDVSFEIKKGESVGIIGPNGSGKSTLLKVLAGVTKPTSGEIKIRGKVASILDIGAGFHPELSGRENIFLNGQIQGFTKKEIRKKYNDIVIFSGIEEFIEEPVKNYSNGMYLRLAFSIMAHLDFDVYLFDEVFSVGDLSFNKKTTEKFQELLSSDKTILFVSHNLNELIDKNKYLSFLNGRVIDESNDLSIINKYVESVFETDKVIIHTENTIIEDFSNHTVSDEIKVLSLHFGQNETKEFIIEKDFNIQVNYEKLKDTTTIDIFLEISDARGNLLAVSSPYIKGKFNYSTKKGLYKIDCIIPAPFFNEQIYRIGIIFLKNLNKNLTNDNPEYLQTILNATISLPNIITFKPMQSENKMIHLGDLTIGGLLPNFEWKINELC